MKIKTIITLAFLLTFISAFCQSTALSKAIQKTMPAVFLIKTYDIQGEALGLGTGFFIDSTGTGITNHHVLEGAAKAEIFLQDDRTYQISYTDGEDKTHDIIRFHIAKSNNNKPKFKFLRIANKPPQIGEDVFTIGNPKGLSFTASNGIVSSVRDDDEMGLIIQTTAPISQGSSGSPLLDIKGEVIGIITFYLKEGQNLNFAFSSKYIKSLKKTSPNSTFPNDLNSDNNNSVNNNSENNNPPIITGKVTDINGNIYNTIKIGNQVWMEQNLSLSIGNSWCNQCETYGRLYDWETAKRACPSGWHLPSKFEWQILIDYEGGENGGALGKLTSSSGWNNSNTAATNSSGFTALPGGERDISNGLFDGQGGFGFWWTATEEGATGADFCVLSGSVVYMGYSGRLDGYSVRCVKDY